MACVVSNVCGWTWMMNVIVTDVIVDGEQKKKKKWKNGRAWNTKSDGVW